MVPQSYSVDTTDEAILAQVIERSKETSDNAGIASVDESIISSAIEASLRDQLVPVSPQEQPQSLESVFGLDENDALFVQDSQLEIGVEKCQHVKDAVKQKDFKRAIMDIKDWDHCCTCVTMNAKFKTLAKTMRLAAMVQAEFTADELPADALWICLTCGEINCGRALKEHAVAHEKSKKSSHPLAMNLASLDCWCYECDDQLLTTKGRNPDARECQTILAKTLQARQAKARAISEARAKNSKGGASTSIASTISSAKSKVHAPGLQNLGNTCFFNSVVQVLIETQSLRSIFSESDRANFPPSLSIATDKGLGPLTTVFKDFLSTMWKQQGGTVTPRDLFTQIAKKWKVFRGFQEQDSQELMRHLLDGIRQEELDLIKKRTAIENDPSTSACPSGVDLSTSKLDYIPFIDSCFSGKLVSVIVCDACKKCSYAYEPYFDLSLPVRGLPEPPAPEGGSLKALLMARSRNMVDKPDADNSYGITKEEQGSEAHLRHVEKLLKTVPLQSSSGTLSIERSLNQFTSVDSLDGENKFACENCYKIQNEGRVTPELKSNGTTADGSQETEDQQVSADVDKVGMATKIETETKANGADGKPVERQQPKKHVLRKAYKRYLVSTLPPTLVLHLKRFEQANSKFGMMRKIEDQVDIPVELDMAPYCIPKSEVEEEEGSLENQDQESKIKELAVIETTVDGTPMTTRYRLYGATVHQGSLASGHYTNFVLSSKVEAPLASEKDNNKPALHVAVTAANGQVLPDIPLSALLAQQTKKKGKKGGGKKGGSTNNRNGQVNQGDFKANTGEVEMTGNLSSVAMEEKKEDKIDTRQWIHCSDTNVRQASLEEVLESRPYLLYYERF
ncbi:hypothetical protein BGZ83_010158 [Gryganskiella cystojenkinii]|nr:hypothetical protein BGZ83_010158 [Gryganskiella cystojenkinii]